MTTVAPVEIVKTRERVYLDEIDPNPYQPRLEIDQNTVRARANSIREVGLLQVPLCRRTDNGRFQLAFGHVRVAACALLHSEGFWPDYIDMDIADLSDQDMAVMALTENESRQQLSQLEVIRGYQKAVDETGLTRQALADKLGMARPALSNNLRVLRLPDFILEHVESGALRLTVAREFLVLQNDNHTHTEDMQEIVRRILNPNPYETHQSPPDWTRRNVRRHISERVQHNEEDYRPIGPKPAHAIAGATREPTFDVEAFVEEHKDYEFHIIPTGADTDQPGRKWTCAVKDWTRAQTRATREANKSITDAGAVAPTGAKNLNHDSVVEDVLAQDPVWQRIAAAREEPGPDRPQTDEEREQIGTRAQFREVDSYGGDFMKFLERVDADQIHVWEKDYAGAVPPWFPDLDECRNCTIGAAYAKTRYGGHGLDKPTLVCFNREHYQQKLAEGEYRYREEKAAQYKGLDRQDATAIERFTREFESLSDEACQALAFSLLSAQPELEWRHPLGRFHQSWSYEGVPAARVRELIAAGGDDKSHRRWRWTVIQPESLDSVALTDFRELAGALVAHHMRLAGKLDTGVSRETPESPPVDADVPAPTS